MTEEKTLGHPIGCGRERTCYTIPGEPDKIIKISPAGHDKQTRREIEYFSWLQKRGVPFDMIPKFYGAVRINGQLGIKQQAIFGQDGRAACKLVDYLRAAQDPAERLRRNVAALQMLAHVRSYLERWNIMICDLNPHNILVIEQSDGSLRPWLIDGLGTTDGIPLARYVPLLGRLKIRRQLARLEQKIPRIE